MDKNAIKKYAVWARRELIERVAKKAQQYGIEENVPADAKADSIGGKLLTPSEKKERQALIAQIQDKGYEQVMEKVAYTWFNRFSALRFMEVNGYLPTHVRVFTDEANNFKPQILAEAIHIEMDGLDMEKVFALKDDNQTDELYKYLLITQCNALNPILPGMFQKIADYTELLFPDNLLREGSVIEQMVSSIDEADWKDAVQIIGWLYQYYNSEKKDEVFAALKKNIKITKENIPAATQLFTPDWIVRYMVENSLGRLWIERCQAESGLNSEYMNGSYFGWKYYLDEAEQEPEVQTELNKIRAEHKNLKPEEIRCIDPCCGSGHILAYMFDVLMQIYESYGYTAREAATSIVENNIYGLDIDDRAAQLASFAVMMKARQYDRRFFAKKDDEGNLAIPQPKVYAICESNHVDLFAVEYFWNGDSKLEKAIDYVIRELKDAKEYGSILNITPLDWVSMYARFDEIRDDINMQRDIVLKELLPLVQVAEVLAQKYDVVVTNPPYMGNMSVKMTEYVKQNYAAEKYDLYAVMTKRSRMLSRIDGYVAMITQQAWMFLSSFDKFRDDLSKTTFINMLQLGARAFEEIGGEVVQTVTFVLQNRVAENYVGTYKNLTAPASQDGKMKEFFIAKRILNSQKEFKKIPGNIVAYWVASKAIELFEQDKLDSFTTIKSGIVTGNNDYFLRLWYEIDLGRICFDHIRFVDNSNIQWVPMHKGGGYRKHYGLHEYVMNLHDIWEPDKTNVSVRRGEPSYYFKEGLTWSTLSNNLSVRQSPKGFVFDTKGSMCFVNDTKQLPYIEAILNSVVASYYMSFLSPTLDFNQGAMSKIPVLIDKNQSNQVNIISANNVQLCKSDWDSFETSWDFAEHPLVKWVKALWDCTAISVTMDAYYGAAKPKTVNSQIELCYLLWQGECNERFNQLKANEEELNRIFIDIYGLQDELAPEVEDKDVTVRKADLQRDVKSLISYAVGCMFGRYSLDVDGLAYAGGEWNESKYKSYPADKDNIIPICDDEYFEDDIVGRFVNFIEVVYGKETLQENLKFIADALGGKGQPKEVIRNYFMYDFYKDHCKVYQKRPIYWQFDSGKKNGFKCLIYMHRYQPDTIMRIRTDYVHEQQSRYRTAIADLEQRINGASTSERVKLTKKLTSLQAQATEIREYEEKIHHLADQMIRIDLDDGVKHNYEIFKDVLAKIK